MWPQNSKLVPVEGEAQAKSFLPADELGLRSVITQYELELSDCEAAQPEAVPMPSCFDSCRSMGGTEGECNRVCKDSE